MLKLLTKVHRSRFMRGVYQHIPILKHTIDKMHAIYTGRSEYMANWFCWQIFYLTHYSWTGFNNAWQTDGNNTIYINPARIILIKGSESAPRDDIAVKIDRHGRFVLERGIGQLAKALDSKAISVPAIVTKRHYQWVNFRKEIYSYSQEQPKGTYQPPVHPDLQWIPSQRKDVRWEYIINNLSIGYGTVLDIGANWGYFCHKFEDIGFECYAAENNHRWLYFMNKLRIAEDKRFHVLPNSVFDVQKKDYDIVLALSVFHHFLRSERGRQNLTKFLNELKVRFMFLEPLPTVHNYKEIPSDYTEDKFIDYIIANSCLSQYKYLGKTERGRNMYLLT